jgi:hypothetical protein
MINKALDLPFDEPQETYSTSEHLFHDLGIPVGTKGRIVDPAPVERAPRESDSDRRSRSSERPARSRTNRERTRTRSGQQQVATTPAEASGGEKTGSDRPSRNRRRRRSPGTSTAS